LCASRTLSCSRTHIIVPDMRIDMFCPKRPSRTTACTYSKRFLLTKTYICNRIDQFSVRLSTAKTDKTGSVEKSAPLRRGWRSIQAPTYGAKIMHALEKPISTHHCRCELGREGRTARMRERAS
jgi:hypothetical protein